MFPKREARGEGVGFVMFRSVRKSAGGRRVVAALIDYARNVRVGCGLSRVGEQRCYVPNVRSFKLDSDSMYKRV